MKTNPLPPNPAAPQPQIQNRGFALVVTLSLMILLTIIAVGLLSLSSIALRASGQADAMATARANARLALMLAIGDLQKNAGPDQRITARADIRTATADGNSRLTGVWSSWDISATSPPSPSDYETTERDKKFLGWLTSSKDGKTTSQINFANTAIPAADAATLWGTGSLGAGAATKDIVKATKVATSPSKGAYAYAVLDEGVKVRINTPYDEPSSSDALKIAQLGSGQRPKVSSIPTLSGLQDSFFEFGSSSFQTIQKGITPQNLALAADNLASGSRSLLQPLTHDVTSTSAGLFTDTAKGGLKEDFNLLANASSTPSPYNNTDGVYVSRLGMTKADVKSDPRWEPLLELTSLYKNTSQLGASGSTPVLQAKSPSGWAAASTTGSTTTVNPEPPPGLVLMPTIANVQVLYSLIGRDLYGNLPAAPIMGQLSAAQKANGIHGPQDGHFRNSRYDYDLHLLYTPIATLHNPYNVTLQFSAMEIDFVDIPFSMQVFRNGQPQSTGMVPVDSMTQDNEAGNREKVFSMKLKAAAGSGSTAFRMAPGEVRMFSAYINPNLNWTASNRSNYWDIYLNSSKTRSFDSIPGWRGDGIGFDCDWLLGNKAIDGLAANGRWRGCLGLAWDDQIHVEFEPVSRPGVTKFVVKVTATTTAGKVVTNAMEMDYGSNDGLKRFMENQGISMPMRYPKASASPNVVYGWNLVDRATTPISSLAYVKPFALFSVKGKTTTGGMTPTDPVDGRYAAKPWTFGHANSTASSQKITVGGTAHPAALSHEIDLQLLENGTNNLFQADTQNRGRFVSGNSSSNGVKFGLQSEIPFGPIQTLVSLNSANPGGSSGYLPRFAQPIGNSWAHPMLDPSRISTSGGLTTTSQSYSYLDHSFLLNLALYDHYYFSGLADQSGRFGAGDTAAALAQRFADGTPLTDPRLTLYQPDGRPASELASVVSGTNPHTRIAAWQMMNGAFNINSTSVSAWKAMLGSVHNPDAIFNKSDLTSTIGAASLSKLPATASGTSRISRFRLPGSESVSAGADPKTGYWMGPREYSDADLQTLAEKIVQQVRQRGPFLSMSEFVNRRLGPVSDEKAQRGALQQAIDNSDLNKGLANTAEAGFEIPQATVASYNYANPNAAAGSSYQGAPGYLSQSDILAVLGNAATPRSDTFTIRGYGEARDASDKPIATAVCEATVQRVPEYVDPVDSSEVLPASLTSNANKTFGRRFQIVSFRWLAASEI